MLTINEFRDSYLKYIENDANWYNRVKSDVETDNGEYHIWYSSIGGGIGQNSIMQMGSVLYFSDCVDSEGYPDISANIRLEVKEDLLNQRAIMKVFVNVPTDIASYEDEFNDRFVKLGFELDYIESGEYSMCYTKLLKEVKDFEYYPKFLANISNRLLDYMAFVKYDKINISQNF